MVLDPNGPGGLPAMDPKLKAMSDEIQGLRHLLSHLQSKFESLDHTTDRLLATIRERHSQDTNDRDRQTSLLSRAAFYREVDLAMERAKTTGQDFGLLVIDIDHLKRINDQQSYRTGDAVIAQISELIKQVESPTCPAGRLRGEEFALIIPGPPANSLGQAEFLRRRAAAAHGPMIGPEGEVVRQVQWKCTISIGVASASEAQYDASRLLVQARNALKIAKDKGRNQVRAA